MIKIQIDGGESLAARAKAYEKSLAEGMTAAATLAGKTARDVLRYQAATFIRAGSMNALNSIKTKTYPDQGTSIEAAAIVYMRGDYWEAHAKGVTIRANNARWLVIPLPAARSLRLNRSFSGKMSKDGKRRLTIQKADIPEGLEFVPISPQRALLVLPPQKRLRGRRGDRRAESYKSGDRQGPAVPMFLLQRQVRLPKRMSLEAAEEKGGKVYFAAVKSLLDALKL